MKNLQSKCPSTLPAGETAPPLDPLEPSGILASGLAMTLVLAVFVLVVPYSETSHFNECG